MHYVGLDEGSNLRSRSLCKPERKAGPIKEIKQAETLLMNKLNHLAAEKSRDTVDRSDILSVACQESCLSP